MSDSGLDRVVEALQSWQVEREEWQDERATLVEDLNQVKMMFAGEDKGWSLIKGGGINQRSGPELGDIKELAETIREYRVGAPLIKRAIALRTTYVFSKGMTIPGYSTEVGVRKSPGRAGRKERFFSSEVNRQTLFVAESKERLESSAATEGNVILIGDESSLEVRQIPLDEIASVMTNPDYRDEIWAVMREWSSMDSTGKAVTKKRWVYTDEFPGTRQKTINKVPVDTVKTVFIQRFNPQAGCVWGIPDAVAAVRWARIYTDLVMSGKAMTESLAKFALKATGFRGRKVPDLGAQMGNGSGKGIALGEGQDLVPLSSAGRAYDFDGVRPIAALVATAMEVSIVHLLSDPGAAGSSYGSASNLDLPTKRAMVFRQTQWADFYGRILKWGTKEDIVVSFPALEDPDLYREMQTATLAWNSGTVHVDEMRPKALEIAGIAAKHPASPEGVKSPNNEKYDQQESSAVTSASPDQGQSNGTGGVGNDSALKSDLD